MVLSFLFAVFTRDTHDEAEPKKRYKKKDEDIFDVDEGKTNNDYRQFK